MSSRGWFRRRRPRYGVSEWAVPATPQPVETQPDEEPVTQVVDLSHIRQAVEWFTALLSGATLVTALLFWFGWSFTQSRSIHFGIDPSSLGFTPADFIVRSVDPIFIPAPVTLLGFLVFVAVHAGLSLLKRLHRFDDALKWIAVAGMAGGFLAIVIGALSMLVPIFPARNYLATPALTGLGALISGYGYYLSRRVGGHRPLERRRGERIGYATVAAIVILNLFLAFSQYAEALGTGRALALEGALESRPAVTVYSAQSLGISNSHVLEETIQSADSKYHVKYSGLRMYVEGGGKYFLLSDCWSPRDGIAVVIPETDDIRVEFSASGWELDSCEGS